MLNEPFVQAHNTKVTTPPTDLAFALMLACADWPVSKRLNAIEAASARLEGDWDRFVALLERHHMIGLARRALDAAGIAPPPELDHLAREQQSRALRLCGRSLQLIDQLGTAGIEAVLLKGPLLSDQLYGDLAIRHSRDIDILVGWEAFAEAIAVLEGLGFTLKERPPAAESWRIDPWRMMAKDVTLYDPQSGLLIELHHRLTSPAALLPGLDMAAAREHRKLGGRDLRIFPREDLFVYLCVHGSTSFWHRLKWLADIHALIEGLEPEAIERLQAHSERLGTERCSALALLLVRDLWMRDLPQSLNDMLRTDHALSGLLKTSRRRLLGGERAPSSWANTWQRRHRARLRKDGAYRRSVWRESIHDPELLERHPLARQLRWLYLPLRVALFARRKLGLRRGGP